MPTLFDESDPVRLAVPLTAQLIGSAGSIDLPAGAAGIVVQVHHSGTQCQSYDIECPLPGGQWAVATVPEANLIRPEHIRNRPDDPLI